MKIVVVVRTRNEERNIERFCMAYQWTDAILVADGGSEDNTVAIAKKIKKVQVRDYPIRVPMENGLWRNPHGPHINFLLDWARFDEQPDWIIFDDCDCFPNYLLKREGRSIFESTDKNFVYVTRLYLYGNRHFPRLAQPGKEGQWEPSLWAWRANPLIRFRVDHPEHLQQLRVDVPKEQALKLMPPYCLLHRAWPTETATNAKVEFYRKSGQIPGMLHPLEFGGDLEPLPEWARE